LINDEADYMLGIVKRKGQMIDDFKKLSEALDEAALGEATLGKERALGAKLAATIREQRARIQQEIAAQGVAFVNLNGRRFKVLPAGEQGAAAGEE
jgi:hypothetical protein